MMFMYGPKYYLKLYIMGKLLLHPEIWKIALIYMTSSLPDYVRVEG